MKTSKPQSYDLLNVKTTVMEILRTFVLVVTGALTIVCSVGQTTATQNPSQDTGTILQTDPFPAQQRSKAYLWILGSAFYFKVGTPFPFILICLPVGTWRSSEPSGKKDSNGIREGGVNKSTKRNRREGRTGSSMARTLEIPMGRLLGLLSQKLWHGAYVESYVSAFCWHSLERFLGSCGWSRGELRPCLKIQ